jgi:hypothetical protein
MSLQMVKVVVHTLVTDDDLRLLFAIDPALALADLNLRGFVLTREEMDVFLRTDARLWILSPELMGDRRH